MLGNWNLQAQQISSCFPVELPAVDAGVETGACPGYWERDRDESGRANPPECPLRSKPDQGGEGRAGFPSADPSELLEFGVM